MSTAGLVTYSGWETHRRRWEPGPSYGWWMVRTPPGFEPAAGATAPTREMAEALLIELLDTESGYKPSPTMTSEDA